MPAKSEGVAQSNIYNSFLGLIESEIQALIDFRVIGEMVDGGRDDIVPDSQHRGNGFN